MYSFFFFFFFKQKTAYEMRISDWSSDVCSSDLRKILMPFFWNTIASQGQIYGNRRHGNNVDCSNTMWFSYPGYHEILSGFADDENINSNKKVKIGGASGRERVCQDE